MPHRTMAAANPIEPAGKATSARRPVCLALAALAMLAPSAAWAGCNAYPFTVSQPAVERFVVRPSRLLDEFRDGGAEMTSLVSLIASSSRAVIPALITQARMATPQQRRAIAYGMANAAKLCAGRSRETTQFIEDTVRKQTETAFQADFRAGLATTPAPPQTNLADQIKASRPAATEGGNSFFDPSNPGAIQPIVPQSTVPQIRRFDQPIR